MNQSQAEITAGPHRKCGRRGIIDRPALIWLVLTLLGGVSLMAVFAFGWANQTAFAGSAILAIVLLGLRDIFEASHVNRARQSEMQEAASRLRLSFRANSPFNVLGWPTVFRLTGDGMKRQQELQRAGAPTWTGIVLPTSSNVMQHSFEDGTVAIFDYVCERSRSDDVTQRQTVLAVRSSRLKFPHFTLTPATLWDRVCKQFSRRVVIQHRYRVVSEGGDSGGPWDERLLALLDGKSCLEAGEGFLLLYRRDKLVDPHDLEGLLSRGLEIFASVCRPTLQPDRERVDRPETLPSHWQSSQATTVPAAASDVSTFDSGKTGVPAVPPSRYSGEPISVRVLGHDLTIEQCVAVLVVYGGIVAFALSTSSRIIGIAHLVLVPLLILLATLWKRETTTP